jgi:hypothetical protein
VRGLTNLLPPEPGPRKENVRAPGRQNLRCETDGNQRYNAGG